MAKKSKSVFMCKECGNEFAKWQGQCSFCGAWNSIVEQKLPAGGASSRGAGGAGLGAARPTAPVRLRDVGTGRASGARLSSGISEFDRVLGGGFVPGSLVLISGEPGIGKSTMIIQTASNIAASGGPVLYVSGEESEEQVKLRADRVCSDIPDSLLIYPETSIENVATVCEELKPSLLIVDSIQTMYTETLESVSGSISQVRECSLLLMKLAKTTDIPIVIVAHVNKSGELAGPKTIEHMVDCVLNFNGERDKDLRILRAFKNRFGTTDEIGAFMMTSEGMKEVSDLSGRLIESGACEEGAVISASYEGSRAVFFEIQALVARATAGFARRTSIGIDSNRLNMILAVLDKKAGIRLLDYDVYVNVAGGVRPGSPATDLAVVLAVAGSLRERTSPHRTVAVGEVGLTGRLRSVHNIDKIVAEAKRLGYDTVIVPPSGKASSAPDSAGGRASGVRVLTAETVTDAIRLYFE